MKVLLVEPAYASKYPPLGLMKISTKHRLEGDEVSFVKGISKNLIFSDFDKVYVTSLYTYEAKAVIDSVKYYKEKCRNADIMVGGIYATLMPDHLRSQTGVEPYTGIWDEVECLPPDYGLWKDHSWSNTSFVFTSRGCPNKCGFCAVKTLEPTRSINPRWKEHIFEDKPRIMIHDNNITASSFGHFARVITYLAKTGKLVTFDNGFDCRHFTSTHSQLISFLNIQTIRFAFDSMAQDGHIQRALENCLNAGIPPQKILVYVLFNYKDSPKDAYHRAKVVADFGARPYAMQYTPLDALDSFSYYSPSWDKETCIDFFNFVNVARLANAMTFDEWRSKWKKRWKHKKQDLNEAF